MYSSQQLTEQLKERFGLTAFRGGQLDVITRLLDGKSTAAIFPTGGGKSLCYQLPGVLLDGLTIVVSPLLALMREQVDYLRELGIEAGRLDSSLSADEARETMADIRSGKLKLLYVAPERFFNERFRGFIASVPISMFAVDEAHCISQWGHSFRPDYLKLAKIARDLGVGRVLALTATATPAVLEDIQAGFDIAVEDSIQTEFYRKNLALRFTLSDQESRDQTLLARLKSAPPQPTLVYVSLQRTAESVTESLAKHDLPVRAYHAGLPDEERRAVQDWFMESPDAIVVATIAFGMGIDKSDIRAIYHYNTSKSIENYAQEVGRAGRDGSDSVCETLVVPEDRIVLDNFAHGDTPSTMAVQRFVELLIGQPKEFFASYYSLAYEADIREPVIRTLMTHLELSGTLESTASRYDSYQFKALVSSAEILEHFKGERRQFATSVLALTVKKKIWFHISLAQAANRLACDRERIVKMLEFFSEQGWVELRTSGLVFGYRKVKSLGDIEALTQELHEYLERRESGEVARLNQLFDLMCSGTCQSQALSEHFGQSIDQTCGKCSACIGQSIGQLPQMDKHRVGDSALRGVTVLAEQHPEILPTSRERARFLCGMNSPKLIRKRLTSNPLYGCCSEVPFQQVIDFLESN
ncbi:MAG: ATP-dependent DNA helicase RecQ [Aureliella sp.]